MKKIIIFSLLIIAASKVALGQTDTCSIQFLTDRGRPTNYIFYLLIGKDSIISNAGILVLDKKKFGKYKDSIVKLRFKNETDFAKLYKKPTIAISDTSTLKNICGVIKLERKY